MRFAGMVVVLMISMAVSSCTTASRIYERNGREALLIECGAALSFSVCHERALKECPSGYTTISETPGFNRKEIRIRCNEPIR